MALIKTHVSEAQFEDCLHLLAAAAHRQWAHWHGYIAPILERRDYPALFPLRKSEPPADLRNLLVYQASGSIELIGRVMQDYPVPDVLMMIDHKLSWFRRWIHYCFEGDHSKLDESLERWKLLCDTPFLKLTPEQQASNYRQAVRDITDVAKATGHHLILPDPLPAVRPRTAKTLRSQRICHALGLHGQYGVAEAANIRVCQACNNVSANSKDG
jgi:hypothetical protein